MIFQNQKGNSVDALLLTTVKLIATIISLITIRIISDKFSYSDYGTYNQAVIIASTMASIIILGFTDATNYFFNKYSSNDSVQKEYLSTIVVFQVFLGSLTGLIIIFLKSSIAKFMDNESLLSIIKWVAFTPLLSNILSIQQILFISLGKSKVIAARNLFISIFRLLVILIAAYVTKNIVTILVAMLFCDIIQVFYFTRLLSKDGIEISFKAYSNRILKNILIFALPMSMFVITNSLMRDCDKYIVSYYTDPETFAVYSNASRILPFSIIVDSFTTVLIPIITKSLHNAQIQNVEKIYKNYLNLSLTISWILITGAVVCASDLILILYGNKYVVGLSIFIVYLIVSLARFANLSLLFSASGNSKIIMKISIGSLVANILLSLLLFDCIGILGCAIATLVVTVLVDIIYLYKGKTILNISLFRLFEGKYLFKLLFQSLLIGAIVLFLQKYMLNTHLFMRFLVTYGIYVLGLSLINRNRILQYFKDLNRL